MEIAIPGIALGLLYVANNQNKEEEKVNENFTSRSTTLPNTNIPVSYTHLTLPTTMLV